MLNVLTLKNDETTIYYILKDKIVFQIRKIRLSENATFIFFDYTFKETKFKSFKSIDEAKEHLKTRFEQYLNKFNKRG